MAGEIPQQENKRGGPGWWMDRDGTWRPPKDWPEDYPPLHGWKRDDKNRWRPPGSQSDDTALGADVESFEDSEDLVIDLRVSAEPPVAESKYRPPLEMSRFRAYPVSNGATSSLDNAVADTPKPLERSLQAQSDIRAMLLVGTAIGVALVLLVGALVLQSRAGAAAQDESSVEQQAPPEVVFAAETEAVREQRRQDARAIAPGVAREQLAGLELAEVDADAIEFDESLWTTQASDCLDISERVLIDRSAVPIIWADNLECVASVGLWTDPYLGIELTRTVDAEVIPLVPFEIVNSSGGNEWTPATRAAFVNDIDHPATLAIVAAGSGHNPRNAGPDVWRPSNEAAWCGYGVDWVAIKARWELSVSSAEFTSLGEMLDTCDQAGSNGAHAASMVIDPLDPPTIERS